TWPNNSQLANGFTNFGISAVTPPGHVVVSGSVVTVTGLTSAFNQNGITIATAASIAGAPGYVGQVWQLPYVVEIKMDFDNTPTVIDAWQSFWTMATEVLAVNTLPLGARFIENDYFEVGNAGTNSAATHDWTVANTSVFIS